MTAPVRLQPLTRARVATLGDAGAAWHAGLPEVLGELGRRWSLTWLRPVPGGSASYVVRARTAAGEPVVVKVAVPGDALVDQAATLRRADGRGYVRLLDYADDHQALLLAALGPPLEHAGRPPEEQLVRLADTLALAWQDPAGRPGTDKAAGLAELVADRWPRWGHPAGDRVRDQALRYADQLSRVDAGALVVVHGDPHPGNLLAAPSTPTGYVFVDPDGFVCDRAYDLGVALRDWCRRLLDSPDPRTTARRYCRLLADRSGVDEERIWAWGYLERVSTGLYVSAIGSPAVGRPYLASAERLLDG